MLIFAPTPAPPWIHWGPMKVFLSWSGEQSKAVARALREWLPLVIQNLDPWMSQKDLGAGDRWSAEIQGNLAESKFGIICVTPDNQRAPWLNFEAGAISNSVTSAKVVPYVFEMEFADIAPGPLTQFQAKQASREGTLEVVQALNAAMERPLAPQVLAETFEMAWPRLEAKLREVPKGQPAGQAVERTPQRSADEKLDEALVLLRNLSLSSTERAMMSLERTQKSKLQESEKQYDKQLESILTIYSEILDYEVVHLKGRWKANIIVTDKGSRDDSLLGDIATTVSSLIPGIQIGFLTSKAE